MSWKKGKKIPTNLIIGFLGSGKTTAITKLIEQRSADENWSILINEFGAVSIDHALVESGAEGISVEELGGGCACCTLALVFRPLLAQFIRRTKPDRLILEPSGVSHPAKVVDILRSPTFSKVIDLRNIICIIDPKDFADPRWRETAVFQDQVQLADIVALNWTDSCERELVERCRSWVENFTPPKQLIVETSFADLDAELLDRRFETIRFPIYADAHPVPAATDSDRVMLELASASSDQRHDPSDAAEATKAVQPLPTPRRPVGFRNEDATYDACGWVFHVDDVFDRDRLLDLLGYVHPIVRLKGVFRCEEDWWAVNRAKQGTRYAPSAYRRDSRLEIIVDRRVSDWSDFEAELLGCLID